MRKQLLALGAAILVSSCGGGEGGNATADDDGAAAGADFPDQYAGTWAADCASPFAKFEDGGVTLYPVTKPYPLKEAKVEGSNLLVSYTSPDVPGTVTETYAIEGDTLRLTTSAVDGKVAATWTKKPMQKCS
ncbi:hypothetical protein M9978_02025 [Sphingomonas sp. MG17]|uniref:Lipoprotein n=1 Tax=Sphingomonas tagetis TaxID=2949092 RepID=A0A9X2KN20_9SPHN|nr:hypothetical protein [Sphingomonas tagetis]MCP3729193.1 hypothetical protein [Sphingomonas tagetis]